MNKFLIILFLPLFISAQKTCEFKKIIYHTSMCFGRCPVYHLQIEKNRNVKLHAERVYKQDSTGKSIDDSTQIGYFTGKVDKQLYNELIKALQTANPDKLEFDGKTCCDGSVTTIILYYQGKRKFLESMFPPQEARPVISILSQICKTGQLKRTKKKFVIEKDKGK